MPDKELERAWKKTNILNDILEVLAEKPHSIAEISRKLSINRSTLRYYLSQLEAKNQIKKERKENEAGRPTMIKINKKQMKKEWQEELKKAQEFSKKTKKSPYTKKILDILKEGDTTTEKILEETKDIDSSDKTPITSILSSLHWLKSRQYIEEVHRITKKGKKILEEIKDSTEKEK